MAQSHTAREQTPSLALPWGPLPPTRSRRLSVVSGELGEGWGSASPASHCTAACTSPLSPHLYHPSSYPPPPLCRADNQFIEGVAPPGSPENEDVTVRASRESVIKMYAGALRPRSRGWWGRGWTTAYCPSQAVRPALSVRVRRVEIPAARNGQHRSCLIPSRYSPPRPRQACPRRATRRTTRANATRTRW